MLSQVDQLREWRQKAYLEQNYSSAELLADKVLTFTNDPQDAYWLAQIYYAIGNYLRGSDLLVRNKFTSKNLKCRYVAARCLIAVNELEDALALIGNVPEPEAIKDGDDPHDWAYLSFLEGQVYTNQNIFESAKRAYERAVLLDPTCYEAFKKLVNHQLLTPEAQTKLVKRIKFDRFGDSEDLLKALYSIRVSQLDSEGGASTEALVLLKDEYNLGSNSDIVTEECIMLYTKSKFKDCRKLCEDVLAIDPYNYRVYPSYLACLHELGETNILYKMSHDLAASAPENPVSWVAVGIYYMSVSNVVEARRYFSKASLMDAYFGEAWLGFAHTFAQEGEHEQAITAYSTAARLFPGSHAPYMFLGMQHSHLNNLSLAEEYFLTASSIYDKDPLLLNEMGVVYYHKNDLERAGDFFRRAMDLAASLGSDAKTWTSIKANMGHVLRRLGMYEESLEYFQDVAWHTQADAGILTTMGLVYLMMEDIISAIEKLNEALSISRDDPIASDLLRRAVSRSVNAVPMPTIADKPLDLQQISSDMHFD